MVYRSTTFVSLKWRDGIQKYDLKGRWYTEVRPKKRNIIEKKIKKFKKKQKKQRWYTEVRPSCH